MSERHNDTAEMLGVLLVYLLFICSCLCFSSCAGPRMAVGSMADSVRTVISERVVFRDTVILVPVQEGADRAVLPDSDTSRLRTGLAESEAFVSGGMLHHTLRNRSELLQPITLSLPERILQTEHSRQISRTVTVEVERELTGWQKFLLALGRGTLVAAVSVVAYLLFRIFRRFTS